MKPNISENEKKLLQKLTTKNIYKQQLLTKINRLSFPHLYPPPNPT